MREIIASKKDNIIRIGVWFLLFLLATIFMRIYVNFAQDDAYITYRYARNIANGEGFVYNPDKYVLGTSTPLYTILLALIFKVTSISIPQISLALNFFGLWLGAGLFYEIGRSKNSIFAFGLSSLFLTNPFNRYSIGMETLFLMFLLALIIWTKYKQKHALMAIALGLAMMTRYEMVLLYGIIAIDELFRLKRITVWMFIPGVLFTIWGGFAWWVFGSFIPQSALAKIAAPHIQFLVGAGAYWYLFSQELIAINILLFFLLLGGFVMIFKKIDLQGFKYVIYWTGAYLAASTFLAGSFPWYYVPLMPGFALMVIMGAHYIANGLTHALRKTVHEPKSNLYDLIMIMSLVVLLSVQISFWYKDWQLYKGGYLDNRYGEYLQVADWLEENSYSDQSLAAFEIGYLGYFTDMEIIDLFGLVTPELFEWVDEGSIDTLAHVLGNYSVDYILLPNDEILAELVSADIRYQLVRRFDRGMLTLYQLVE